MARELRDVAGGPLLAVESATRVASVAIVRAGEVLCERSASKGRHNAESLLPLIDEVLARAGLGLGEIAAFAISIGPGAFTSLRIGLATVKGLAFDCPIDRNSSGAISPRRVAPVSTLAALAYGARDLDGPVVALLDARRGQAYAAAYSRADSGLADLLPEGVYAFGALAAALPRPCTLVGEAAPLCAEALQVAGAQDVRIAGEKLAGTLDVRIASDWLATPRASAVAALGARCLARGEGLDPADLVPRYLQRPQAEVELSRRTGGA